MNDPHENATWVYSYDHGGNILSKAKYAYTTGTLGTALETIPYTYGDANWKDKLTAYNGTAITYDAIGNPLNDGAWTFTWAAGRQLKKMVREDRTLDFKYDHNGMRIQKVLQHDWYPETTNYTYHGKMLTHMTVDYYDWDEVAQQDKLHFFYDAQPRPVKISYNGVIYTYVHNLQGDIVGILDSTGALVVEYKYDAWGKLLSTTGSLADTLGRRNPFRYRGYVYDEESALYYLRSRYYNPVIGRFVNADNRLDPRGFGANQFAYCGNNSVNRTDISGSAWYNDVWNWTCNAASDTWNWTCNAASDAWNWTTNAASDAWNWTCNAATDAWNWTITAANDAWNWVKRASGDVWDSIVSIAAGVKNWVVEAGGYLVSKGKEFITAAKSLLNNKGVKIAKGLGGFILAMGKAVKCATIALGVNAIPVPAVSQAACLGYAAKAGYHLGQAYNNLKSVIRTIFFN